MISDIIARDKYTEQEFKDICYFMATMLDQIDSDYDYNEFTDSLNVAVDTLEQIEENMVIQ